MIAASFDRDEVELFASSVATAEIEARKRQATSFGATAPDENGLDCSGAATSAARCQFDGMKPVRF